MGRNCHAGQVSQLLDMSRGWKRKGSVPIFTLFHYRDCTVYAIELIPSPYGRARYHTLTNGENTKLSKLADVARSVGCVSGMGTECGSLDFLRGCAFRIKELLFRSGSLCFSEVAQSRGN